MAPTGPFRCNRFLRNPVVFYLAIHYPPGYLTFLVFVIIVLRTRTFQKHFRFRFERKLPRNERAKRSKRMTPPRPRSPGCRGNSRRLPYEVSSVIFCFPLQKKETKQSEKKNQKSRTILTRNCSRADEPNAVRNKVSNNFQPFREVLQQRRSRNRSPLDLFKTFARPSEENRTKEEFKKDKRSYSRSYESRRIFKTKTSKKWLVSFISFYISSATEKKRTNQDARARVCRNNHAPNPDVKGVTPGE